jgi:DNA-binding winged helix-turn-helix (wHTH) protein
MNQPDRHLYAFGVFRLDTTERLLLRSDGVRVPLTEKAFDTLATLVRRGGHLVSKEDLMAEVWPDSFIEENNVDKSISVIRRALGEKASAPEYIETVRGRGYRFLAQVEVGEETINSIAVLPLINASTDQNIEYLSDG